MKVRLTLKGTAPLLMHNIQLADPLNPVAKQMKAISSKRVKTDDDHAALARLEFLGSLYIADDIGPYLPGEMVESCMRAGGRVTKMGRQVERGLFVLDEACPLLYAGPRNADELWGDEAFRSVRAVRVGQARVMRTRPMFRQWEAECDAELDTHLLSVEQMGQIAETAGQMCAVGDFRPRFGRFTATVARL